MITGHLEGRVIHKKHSISKSFADAQNCTALAAEGNCDFYPQCVETRIPCGTSGYALNYGERYCTRFTDQLNCFTSEGQAWVSDVQMCLMKKILSSTVYNNSGTCQELLEFAYDSHPDCYVDNGFCTDILLSLTNLECLIGVLDSSDMFTRLGIEQIFETAKTCDQQSVDTFLSFVDNWIQSVTGRIEDLLTILRGFLVGCKTGLDLIFVMDASGSVGPANFNTMQNFVVNVTSNFEIRANSTRVGVILYSSSAYIIIPLGSINNFQQLSSAINNITYIGGGTSTDLALDLVPTAFANARINEGIPRVVMLLTDGYSNSPTLTAQAAVRVHDDNIQVYSVGIGIGINEAELLTIASDPSFVYRISDFSVEAFAEELRPLQLTACTTPALTDIGQPLQITISNDQFINLEYNVPPEGLTIKIDISEGEVNIFGSFTIRNPTELTADFIIDSTIESFFVNPELFDISSGILFLTVIGQENNNIFSLETECINIQCGSGETFIQDCSGCELADICLRDNPCRNNGTCLLTEAPNKYMCTGASSVVHPLSIWTTSFIACLVMIISFSSGIMNKAPTTAAL